MRFAAIFFCLMWPPFAEAESPGEQKAEFNFDPGDYLMTVQYYGPDSDKYFALSSGSRSHRTLLKKRATESKHIAFVATSDEIGIWRASMYPPAWRGGVVTRGEFKPDKDYVGYVIHIETSGKKMHSKLGWKLETYYALQSLNAAGWKTRRNALVPLLKSLSEQRRKWAEDRYRSLLAKEWHKIVISTGSGSCWGESCSPQLEIIRKEESGNFLINGTTVESKKMLQFQKTLFRYAVHLELYGFCPTNYWKVYKIEMQKEPKAKLKQVFHGYWAFKPLDGKPFERWLAEQTE